MVRAMGHSGIVGARGRTWVLALVLAAIAGLGTACSEFPFRITEGERPIGTATDIVPRTDPVAVLSNLSVCVADQKPTEYLDQLESGFVFVADQIDVAALEQTYPGVFSDWNKEVESRVTQYMLDTGRCRLAQLTISNETTLDQPTDTTYSSQVDYRLLLYLNDHSQNYSGQARLFMRKDANGLWSIYRWEDIRLQDATEDTWGILRGRIRATM
jgi:hypothetical protein